VERWKYCANYTPMSSEHGCERLSHDQPNRLLPTVNYWIDFARHVLAERGAMCPGERRGGLSGAGGSSFAKGEAQQGARGSAQPHPNWYNVTFRRTPGGSECLKPRGRPSIKDMSSSWRIGQG